MKMRNKFFLGLIGIMLIMGSVFITGCNEASPGGGVADPEIQAVVAVKSDGVAAASFRTIDAVYLGVQWVDLDGDTTTLGYIVSDADENVIASNWMSFPPAGSYSGTVAQLGALPKGDYTVDVYVADLVGKSATRRSQFTVVEFP
jgi:hypothetical protein